MPRTSVLITPAAVDAAGVLAAAEAVRDTLLPQNPGMPRFVAVSVDEGAALQVRTDDDEVVLTVVRPRVLFQTDELDRLLPTLDRSTVPEGSVWTDAYTPWTDWGQVGVLVVQAIADQAGGQAVHSHDRVGAG